MGTTATVSPGVMYSPRVIVPSVVRRSRNLANPIFTRTVLSSVLRGILAAVPLLPTRGCAPSGLVRVAVTHSEVKEWVFAITKKAKTTHGTNMTLTIPETGFGQIGWMMLFNQKKSTTFLIRG